jgi:transposase
MTKNPSYQWIPTNLSKERFAQFVLPHLTVGQRGPESKLSLHAIFNYILHLLYVGCQWKELPIRSGPDGRPEIHYTRIYRVFRRWTDDGVFEAVFVGSVMELNDQGLLDLSIIHGDGTTTAAKKGGDNIGYSGHKKIKGDKVVAFCDRNCNVIAPFVSAAGNRNESPMLRQALPKVMETARTIGLDLHGTIVSLDGVYDCRANRKAIFNRGMTPNINPNPRARKTIKRGRKAIFDPAIFAERFNTIERVFAWEDKFRRLLNRFDRISTLHYAFKSLAYTMINLRHFCRT